MTDIKRWAALDDELRIIKVGLQRADLRFDRRCFHFSFGGWAYWCATGARYCELHERAEAGQHISEVAHGRIRKSQDVPQLWPVYIKRGQDNAQGQHGS